MSYDLSGLFQATMSNFGFFGTCPFIASQELKGVALTIHPSFSVLGPLKNLSLVILSVFVSKHQIEFLFGHSEKIFGFLPNFFAAASDHLVKTSLLQIIPT